MGIQHTFDDTSGVSMEDHCDLSKLYEMYESAIHYSDSEPLPQFQNSLHHHHHQHRRHHRGKIPKMTSRQFHHVSWITNSDRESNLFLYSEPVRLVDRYDLPCQYELCLILIYNMALSFHLRALLSFEPRAVTTKAETDKSIRLLKNCLKKALKFYKLALRMEQFQWCSRRCPFRFFHHLAVPNNIGHIHHLWETQGKQATIFKFCLIESFGSWNVVQPMKLNNWMDFYKIQSNIFSHHHRPRQKEQKYLLHQQLRIKFTFQFLITIQ